MSDENLDSPPENLDPTSAGDEQVPEYVFGDVTPDEASSRFGYLRELPENLRGLEARVSGSIAPVMEQLNELGGRIGSQPAFEPKMERFANALRGYDDKLAEAVMPALLEDLKESMTVTPLGPEMLQPHLNPMLEQQQQGIIEQVLPVFLNMLPFDPDSLVNRDEKNPDNALPAQTELQKDFEVWWEQADAPTRSALGQLGIPYLGALQRFGKWRADQVRTRGEAAGAASERLGNASQRPVGGRTEKPSSGLRTEEDGFNSVFKK